MAAPQLFNPNISSFFAESETQQYETVHQHLTITNEPPKININAGNYDEQLIQLDKLKATATAATETKNAISKSASCKRNLANSSNKRTRKAPKCSENDLKEMKQKNQELDEKMKMLEFLTESMKNFIRSPDSSSFELQFKQKQHEQQQQQQQQQTQQPSSSSINDTQMNVPYVLFDEKQPCEVRDDYAPPSSSLSFSSFNDQFSDQSPFVIMSTEQQQQYPDSQNNALLGQQNSFCLQIDLNQIVWQPFDNNEQTIQQTNGQGELDFPLPDLDLFADEYFGQTMIDDQHQQLHHYQQQQQQQQQQMDCEQIQQSAQIAVIENDREDESAAVAANYSLLQPFDNDQGLSKIIDELIYDEDLCKHFDASMLNNFDQ